MLNRITKRHIALLSLLAILAILSILYFRSDQNGRSYIIRPYDQSKDFQAIVEIVNANKYWVSERPDFSPEQMLLTRAPSSNPERKGMVTVAVAEIDQKTAGYITFYRKSPQHGFIWTLAVDKKFRGKGIGEGLVSHAIAELKKMGASYVTLGTRLMNEPARALYKKLGFIEQSRDEDRGMIDLIKRNL